jgi:hypothetical protein
VSIERCDLKLLLLVLLLVSSLLSPFSFSFPNPYAYPALTDRGSASEAMATASSAWAIPLTETRLLPSKLPPATSVRMDQQRAAAPPVNQEGTVSVPLPVLASVRRKKFSARPEARAWQTVQITLAMLGPTEQ